MKLKSLAVIALLVLGCSAAFGQSYSFGFLAYDPVIQYCDFEVFTVAAPYAAGTHDLTTVCFGLANNGIMVGFKGAIPTSTPAPVTGAVVIMADNTFDAQYGAYSGCQIDWVTKTKASTRLFQYGWSFYLSCVGGSDYLGNYGYLSTTLGAPQQSGPQKTTFGAAIAKAKNKK